MTDKPLREVVEAAIKLKLGALGCIDPMWTPDADIIAAEIAETVLALHPCSVPAVLEAAAQECERQAVVYLSPEYATGQPLSSFKERFACGQCATAIRALSAAPQPPVQTPPACRPDRAVVELVKAATEICPKDKSEQNAFEAWAAASGFDMAEHPLHWLFTDAKTNAARQGWKAAMAHVRSTILSAITPSNREEGR